mgnify:CR=1 FL=1
MTKELREAVANDPHRQLMAKARKPFWKSKKVLATRAGFAGIVVPAIASGGISLPVVLGVAGPVVAYVLSQGFVDGKTATALGEVVAAGIVSGRQ